MGWDGPILTDSGGFQVFSLRDTILAADDDGVTFRSVYDGEEARFTPELAADVQRQLGSDVAMCLDVCPPADVDPRGARASPSSGRRAGPSASSRRPARRGPAPLRDRPGRHRSASCARRSIEEIAALGFDGHALGGLSVGEDREAMLDTVAWAAPLLPAERPRYFMGIGDPAGILDVIERGVDMFDCVLPDPARAHRLGAHLGGAAEPQERPLRPRRRAARRRLPLPGLHRLLARLPAPPRQPAGAARAAPPLRAQRPLPARPHGRRARGDRGGPPGGLQGRRARTPRGLTEARRLLPFCRSMCVSVYLAAAR